MKSEIVYLTVFVSLAFLVYKFYNVINAQFPQKKSEKMVTPRKTDLTEIYKDITLQPYGCFNELDEKFFKKELNIYTNQYDSLVIINDV